VTIPGPGGPLWGVALAAFALASVGLGELVRRGVARRVALFRDLEIVERTLLDFYLGGAAFYVLAVLPPGLFYAPVVFGVYVLGGLGWVGVVWSRRRGPTPPVARSPFPTIRRTHLIVAGCALLLFAVELAAIDGVPTGNTYDASLLSLYTGLLLAHHTLPISLAPVVAQTIAYPQGTTAWLGLAQLVFGLPPARTSLLVTPLFFAALPLGVYAFGRRWTGDATVGVALALVFTLVATWTRGLVVGSNDFVFAVPLVFLLAGWATAWTGATPISIVDALAFGSVAGYAAALNPVGSEWLFLLLPLVALVSVPRLGGRPRAWIVRWFAALGAAVLWILPSLYALAFAGAGGPTGASSPGISLAQWVGSVDPFLFRPNDQFLSPFPLLRAELALMIVAGAWILVRRLYRGTDLAPFGRALLVGGSVLVALLGIGVVAASGAALLLPVLSVLSTNEEAILLFMLYSALAAVPLIALFRWLESPPSVSPGIAAEPSQHRRPAGRSPGRASLVAGAIALVLLLPGGVLTVGQLPSQLGDLYDRYGNVTASDFDLLAWAGSNLPAGSVVVVAPGSAAEFLPAYNPGLHLLYPMSSGYRTVNASYWLVVAELTNGTWDAAGGRALAALGAGYIAVTQGNNLLFRPFDPAPLVAAGYPTVFQEDDAYLFAVAP